MNLPRFDQFFVIAGPCVIESRRSLLSIAKQLSSLSHKLKLPLIFKASYDKANRSSIESFRGPGIGEGLDALRAVREETGLPLLTDIHSEQEIELAARVVQILQIPAFLCRQTDLLQTAAHTGLWVNVKKGQFLAPEDMRNVVVKLEAAGASKRILLTERGSSFGYHNLVVDFRGIPIMKQLGCPVVFDATHSVQKPSAAGDRSGGDSRFVPTLAKAAVAAGCDGLFLETHPNPDRALSDGPNMIPLKRLSRLLEETLRIRSAMLK